MKQAVVINGAFDSFIFSGSHKIPEGATLLPVDVINGNVSSSDVETKDMVSGEVVIEADKCVETFMERWKPLDEVKSVYKRRYAERLQQEIDWHFKDITSVDDKLDFLDDKRSWEGLGNSLEDAKRNTYKALNDLDEKKALENQIVLDLKKIDESENVEDVLLIWDSYEFRPETICVECLEFRASISNNEAKGKFFLNSMWHRLGRECATTEFDRIVRVSKLEFNEAEKPNTSKLGDNLLFARQDFGIRIGADVKDKTALDVIHETVHGFWMPFDRSGTLETSGLKMVGTPIPDASGFSKTLEDVMLESAQKIWDLGKKINVFWSGGIDSTGVLVAFLRTAKPGDLDRLCVCYSEGSATSSVSEYPEFYADFIDGKLNKKRTDVGEEETYSGLTSTPTNTRLSELVNRGELAVSGEIGDQLFGSATFSKDEDLIKMKSAVYLEDARFADYMDEIRAFNSACPTDTSNLTEMLWWWNFAVKWTEVEFRMLASLRSPHSFENVYPFFSTDDFQRWSVSNPDKRIKDTANTYKFALKDFIYEYARHQEYRDEKLKIGSLRVRVGGVAAIDDKHNAIVWGKTSTDDAKLQEKYGTSLQRFSK